MVEQVLQRDDAAEPPRDVAQGKEGHEGRRTLRVATESRQPGTLVRVSTAAATADVALPEVFTANATLPAEPKSLDPAAISANREAWLETWTDTVLR